MYFIAGVLGIAAGFAAWCLASIVIARSITWAESRRPQLAGSTRVRVGEIIACSVAFAGSLLLGLWLARLVTENMK